MGREKDERGGNHGGARSSNHGKMAYMDKRKRFITNNHSNKFLKNLLPMKNESIQRKFYKVSDQNIYKKLFI